MESRWKSRSLGFISLCSVLIFAPGCSTLSRTFTKVIDPITQKRLPTEPEDVVRPEILVGRSLTIYEPGHLVGAAEETPLLGRYAPVIIQGRLPANTDRYDPENDRIGTPSVRPVPDSTVFSVSIDTSRPALFARTEKARIGGNEFRQLVYVFWYPSTPVGLIEQGKIDSGVVRITLDSSDRPAIIEYSKSCGCYHSVFISERVEMAAREQYLKPLKRKKYVVEKHLIGKTDWVVRNVLPETEPTRPILFMGRGKHLLKGLYFARNEEFRGLNVPVATYSIRPYQDLEKLPLGDGRVASMFDSRGFVWGAERKREEMVFTSIDHAGWPRHLDKMLVHFDEARWNDPELLETYLRLPQRFFDQGIALSQTFAAQTRKRDETTTMANANGASAIKRSPRSPN